MPKPTAIIVRTGADESKAAHLRAERQTIIGYLYAKLSAEDWHACADAACDLREIDAKLEVLRG